MEKCSNRSKILVKFCNFFGNSDNNQGHVLTFIEKIMNEWKEGVCDEFPAFLCRAVENLLYLERCVEKPVKSWMPTFKLWTARHWKVGKKIRLTCFAMYSNLDYVFVFYQSYFSILWMNLLGKRADTIRQRLEEVFEQAVWRQPSVVLLDDLDHLTGAATSPEHEHGPEAVLRQHIAQSKTS